MMAAADPLMMHVATVRAVPLDGTPRMKGTTRLCA